MDLRADGLHEQLWPSARDHREFEISCPAYSPFRAPPERSFYLNSLPVLLKGTVHFPKLHKIYYRMFQANLVLFSTLSRLKIDIFSIYIF